MKRILRSSENENQQFYVTAGSSILAVVGALGCLTGWVALDRVWPESFVLENTAGILCECGCQGSVDINHERRVYARPSGGSMGSLR